jgi:hypothetical protein
MIKEQRNLSGIYFRFKNEETGKFENRTFEDLPTDKQNEVMKDRSPEWLQSLAKQLANTLRDVADKFDIVC